VVFAAVLCKDISSEHTRVGHRIGKLGLSLLQQYDTSMTLLPSVHLIYYGHVGILFEPLQACIDMHRRACEIGLKVGDTSIAALHQQFLIVRQLYAGTNLLALKKELEHEIKVTDHYYDGYPVLVMKLHSYYKTVLLLIGTETLSSLELYDEDGKEVYDKQPAYVMSRIITLTFLGHYERVKHIIKRWELAKGENESKAMISYRGIYLCFYRVLAATGLARSRKLKSTNENATRIKEKSIIQSIDAVQKAAELSEWNFRNKASLLLAEKYSLSLKNVDAERQYNDAIEQSKASSFVHEEGLASELAGAHYERLGKFNSALVLFQRAENCYEAWGSTVKSQQMQEKCLELSRS